jgi:trk system potassium uptake protein TrkA
MVNAVEGSSMRAFEGAPGDLELVEIEVAAGAPVAGLTLTDVSLPQGSLVVSEARGDRIAGPSTELTAGERYVVAVEPGVSDEVRQLFRG